MADLIYLGITINIRPNGNMKGFLNGKVVLDSNMHNNVWKTNITELYIIYRLRSLYRIWHVGLGFHFG